MAGLRLPDELWMQILEFGIRDSKFTYKDLCCISISCKRLQNLSDDDCLWSHLLSSDFPQLQYPNNVNHRRSIFPSVKSTYKFRFEREKEKILAVHRRAVFRKESEILERERKIRETETRLLQESERLGGAANELSNLHRVRLAAVALNVWQPEVVRGRLKQTVEQNVVSVEFRVYSLEMELRLCKQQIAGLNKAYRNEKRVLKKAVEELESMKYHPLPDYRLTTNRDTKCDKKRKKLETFDNTAEKMR